MNRNSFENYNFLDKSFPSSALASREKSLKSFLERSNYESNDGLIA